MMLDHRMNDVVLNAQSEWRFHVPAKAVCTITLVHGLAEVFGAEVCAAVFRFASGVLAYDLHSCSCLDALRALVLLLPPVPVLPVLLVAPLCCLLGGCGLTVSHCLLCLRAPAAAELWGQIPRGLLGQRADVARLHPAL